MSNSTVYVIEVVNHNEYITWFKITKDDFYLQGSKSIDKARKFATKSEALIVINRLPKHFRKTELLRVLPIHQESKRLVPIAL